MGWRFRKIFQSGPIRWTWTKRGIGYSWGVPGFRIGVTPSGDRYFSVGIPGTGLYFIKYFGKGKPPSAAPPSLPPSPGGGTIGGTRPTPWWKQKGLGP